MLILSPVGNTPIQLCPKGVSDASDAGDNSKDRILATNGVPYRGKLFLQSGLIFENQYINQ